jgi:hypothetical protein
MDAQRLCVAVVEPELTSDGMYGNDDCCGK